MEDFQKQELEQEEKEEINQEVYEKSFGEYCKNMKVIKKVGKHGISIGITFTKKDQENFNLTYGDEIDLTDAKIIKK